MCRAPRKTGGTLIRFVGSSRTLQVPAKIQRTVKCSPRFDAAGCLPSGFDLDNPTAASMAAWMRQSGIPDKAAETLIRQVGMIARSGVPERTRRALVAARTLKWWSEVGDKLLAA